MIFGFWDGIGKPLGTGIRIGGNVVAVALTVVVSSDLASPTPLSPIPITISFSESVTGFSVSDISVGNGFASSLVGSEGVYTCDITPSIAGAVTVDISGGVCISTSNGVPNSASTQFSITSTRTLYFVRKTGNDSTGDGSTVNPWLTVDKAFQAVPIAGGSTIKIGAGVYSESRFNQFYLNRVFSGTVVIEPESGALDVTVQGMSGTTATTTFEGAGNIRFNKLNLGRGLSQGICLWILGANKNISIVDCVINSSVTSAGRGPLAIWNTTTNATTSGINIDGCTINASGSVPIGYGVLVHAAANGSMISGVTINNCSFPQISPVQNHVLSVKAGTGSAKVMGLTLSNETFVNSVVTPTVYIGDDGVAQGLITGTIVSNCTISGSNHAFEAGFGVNGATISGSNVGGGQYGFVVKECNDVQIFNCASQSGGNSAIYFKASTKPNAHHNTITATQGVGLRLARNEVTLNKCSNWQFQNNVIFSSGSGKALFIGSGTHDTGGGICDYNAYQNNVGLGVVRGDQDVQSLAELQAAWADYDVATNDSHSTVV